MSDDQVRRLEKLRAGNDLRLRADLVAVQLADKTAWPVCDTQVEVNVPHVEWCAAVEQLESGMFVDVLLPITNLETRATAARRLREAKKSILNGDFESAVTKSRQALDAVRGTCNTKAVFSGAVNKKADDRTQEERWAVLVQSAYALFSGAPHDDEGSSEHFTWTRADAVAAVATAAGLLARLEDGL